MKKPSFALYAAGYVLCIAAVIVFIIWGIEFDVSALLVLAGEAAVWSSMIFDAYHKRHRACLELEYDKLKTDQISAVRQMLSRRSDG